MNRDVVTGVAGAIVLVAAMVGVFVYERNVAIAAGTAQTPPTGPLVLDGPGLEGEVALGATEDALLNLTTPGMTNVTFTLTWTATNGRDTLRLTVAPPTGSGVEEGAVSEPEDDGEITVTVAVPNTSPTGTLGAGDWKVSVEFVDASPDTVVDPPVTPPGTTDASVSWRLATTVETRAAP